MDSASNPGRDLNPSCSLSKDAIFTSVATASSAVGASQIVWRPQGNNLLSLSINCL